MRKVITAYVAGVVSVFAFLIWSVIPSRREKTENLLEDLEIAAQKIEEWDEERWKRRAKKAAANAQTGFSFPGIHVNDVASQESAQSPDS